MDSSSNFDIIIPLGATCNISLLLQNLKIKKETSLFEWFISNKLNNITNVLSKIVNKTDYDIIQQKNDTQIYIGEEDIFSSHYNIENFKPIYERRRDRLLDCIKNNSRILFVRFEGNTNIYSPIDIDEFINVIKSINPKNEVIKLFLISPNENELKHPDLISKFYNKHHEDSYCKSREINELFVNTLNEIGYNINTIYDISFNDMLIN